jgi:hypothetical protein
VPVIQAVSPNFHFKDGVLVDPSGAVRDKDDIATKIDIYEDRMRGWSLHWARELSKQHNAGFAVLTLALTYIEGVEQYRAGPSK